MDPKTRARQRIASLLTMIAIWCIAIVLVLACLVVVFVVLPPR